MISISNHPLSWSISGIMCHCLDGTVVGRETESFVVIMNKSDLNSSFFPIRFPSFLRSLHIYLVSVVYFSVSVHRNVDINHCAITSYIGINMTYVSF